MQEDFFDFVKEPTKENFLKARKYVMENTNFNPYSSDLDKLVELLDAADYDGAIEYKSINTVLSPRAHAMKRFAATKKGDDMSANAEHLLYVRITEGLLSTGDGSKSNPYMVTQITDERDIIQYLEQDVESQQLIKEDGKSIDRLITTKGDHFYFDVTDCFKSMQNMSFDDMLNSLGDAPPANGNNGVDNPPKKKWWKFW